MPITFDNSTLIDRLNTIPSAKLIFFPPTALDKSPRIKISFMRKANYICFCCGSDSHAPVTLRKLSRLHRLYEIFLPDCERKAASRASHEYMLDVEKSLNTKAQEKGFTGLIILQKEISKNSGEYDLALAGRLDGFCEQAEPYVENSGLAVEYQGARDHGCPAIKKPDEVWDRDKTKTHSQKFEETLKKDKVVVDLIAAQREDEANGKRVEDIIHLRTPAVVKWYHNNKYQKVKVKDISEYTSGNARVPIIRRFIIIWPFEEKPVINAGWKYVLDNVKKNLGVEVWYEWGTLHRSQEAIDAQSNPIYTPSEDQQFAVLPSRLAETEREKYKNNQNALNQLDPIRKAIVESIFQNKPSTDEQKQAKKERELQRRLAKTRKNKRFLKEQNLLNKTLPQSLQNLIAKAKIEKESALIREKARKKAILPNETPAEREKRIAKPWKDKYNLKRRERNANRPLSEKVVKDKKQEAILLNLGDVELTTKEDLQAFNEAAKIAKEKIRLEEEKRKAAEPMPAEKTDSQKQKAAYKKWIKEQPVGSEAHNQHLRNLQKRKELVQRNNAAKAGTAEHAKNQAKKAKHRLTEKERRDNQKNALPGTPEHNAYLAEIARSAKRTAEETASNAAKRAEAARKAAEQ